MRELKFRAWLRSYGGGSFMMLPKSGLGTEVVYLTFGMELKLGIGYEDGVIMQYTGLKDKNGKEIYEGDVVVFNDTFYHPKPEVVEWFDGAAGFSPFIDADEAEGLAICPESNQCEVIGNVYEHPELVRGKA